MSGQSSMDRAVNIASIVLLSGCALLAFRGWIGDMVAGFDWQPPIIPSERYVSSADYRQAAETSTQDDSSSCYLPNAVCWFPEGTAQIAQSEFQGDMFALSLAEHYRLSDLPLHELIQQAEKDNVYVDITMQGSHQVNHSWQTNTSEFVKTRYDVVTSFNAQTLQTGNIKVSGLSIDNQQILGGDTDLLLVLFDADGKEINRVVIPNPKAYYQATMQIGDQVRTYTLQPGETLNIKESFEVNPANAFFSLEFSNQLEEGVWNEIEQYKALGYVLYDTKSATSIQLNPILNVQ